MIGDGDGEAWAVRKGDLIDSPSPLGNVRGIGVCLLGNNQHTHCREERRKNISITLTTHTPSHITHILSPPTHSHHPHTLTTHHSPPTHSSPTHTHHPHTLTTHTLTTHTHSPPTHSPPTHSPPTHTHLHQYQTLVL